MLPHFIPTTNGKKKTLASLTDIYDELVEKHGDYSAVLYLIFWLRKEEMHVPRSLRLLYKGLILDLSRSYADRDLSIIQAHTPEEKHDALQVWGKIIRNQVSSCEDLY